MDPYRATAATLQDSPAALPRELKSLFEYRPPLLNASHRWSSVPYVSPFWFYDKHLDESLNLLHVKPMPGLPDSLASLVDDGILALRHKGRHIPVVNSTSHFTRESSRNLHHSIHYTRVGDPTSVALFYDHTIANSCESVASVLAIHPHVSDWLPTLMWSQRGSDGQEPPSSWTEAYSIRVRYDPESDELLSPPELLQLLDERTTDNLKHLTRKFPELATCEVGVVSPDTEFILRDMDRLTSDGFNPIICGTAGHLPSTSLHTPPPDPQSVPWSTQRPLSGAVKTFRKRKGTYQSPNTKTNGPRRSWRLQQRSHHAEHEQHPTTLSQTTRLSKKRAGKEGKSRFFYESKSANHPVDVTPPRGCSPCHYLETEHFIQHAWAHAVQKDTTLIIFHCGNFERIGIRGRKSQTLYLSNLIDVVNDTSPARGKLHVGLFMAAYLDTMDRFLQLQELESNPQLPLSVQPTHDLPPTSPKRMTKIEPQATKKRARETLDAEVSIDDADLNRNRIFREAGLRNLALVRLRYGVYNSVAPASFHRIGRSLAPIVGPSRPPRVRRKYSTHEYFMLVVHSTIGRGATGYVHGATLELRTSTETTLTHDVVVKFAMHPSQQERLQHEYSIYRHLSSAGVKDGVVDVLGLFHDLEGGTMALIMNHGGRSLWDCRPNEIHTQVKVSSSERAAFLSAMKIVHDAGVRHNDVRPPNLLLDDAGKVAILDFDRADLDSSEGQRERELGRLADLLDGAYFGQHRFS